MRPRHIPTAEELARLYYELSKWGAPTVGARRKWTFQTKTVEQLIALAGDMLRYDARLLGAMVQWLLASWADVNPLRLRQDMREMRYPQALCVVFEFADEVASQDEFVFFSKYIREGWPKVRPEERFFIDSSVPASRMAQRQAGRNLKPYAKWGFVGTERPVVNNVTKQSAGKYDQPTRYRIARNLSQTMHEFTLADYLDAVDHSVSRQQALHDLHNEKSVKLVGKGRGAKWVRKLNR